MINQDELYLIALTQIPKIGPVLGKNLISYCGGIEAVFKEKKSNLVKIPSVGPIIAANFDPKEALIRAEKELKFIAKNDVQVLSYLHENYPKRLLHVESSPIVLYYKGTSSLNHHRVVAIVGTRQPSDYGKTMCEKIVEGLIPYNVLIVSGLAFGVDSIAHRQSVALNIETIGVMGHGLDKIYPSENRVLSTKMIANGGVLTEFVSETRPDRENFPMRNRIIAAMADAVVVIESKRKGGSIITAEFANEYNRDVFALPGMVTEEYSQGCNNLIKQNKAHLIESAADIAYINRWEEIDAGKVIQKQLFIELEHNEQKIFDIIKEMKESPIDVLSYRSGMPPSEVSSLLLTLEFKGLVKALPGKKFICT